MTDTEAQIDVDAQIKDLWERLNRIEAALDEIARGFGFYWNDKAYEEQEQKKKVN